MQDPALREALVKEAEAADRRLQIIQAGGLMPWLKHRLATEGAP